MVSLWFESRTACPACTSVAVRKIYEIPYCASSVKKHLIRFYSSQGKIEYKLLDDTHYILCECEVCGLIFQKDIPNKIFMERLYGNWLDPEIAHNNQHSKTLDYYSQQATEIMQLIEHFNKLPASLKFFDFGMGWGKWALMAKAFGCNSYGTEICERRIQYARSNGIKVIQWSEIPNHLFDYINTEQVFEHIPDPLQALLYLKQALNTNGIIKISVPNAFRIEKKLHIMDWDAPKGSKNSLNPVAPLEHINCFRRRSLIKMASTAGMKEIFIPLKAQYQFSTNWRGLKRSAKNLALPIYRNLIKKQNCVFLGREE